MLLRARAGRLAGDEAEGGEVVDVLRAGPPEDQVRVGAGRPLHAGEQPLPPLQPDRVDVVLVVPEVERGVDPVRLAPERGRIVGGIVVRLEPVARGRPCAQQLLECGVDVEPAPAGECVPLGGAAGAAGGAVDVVRRPRQQLGHLLGAQVGPDREQNGCGSAHLRRRERRALALAEVVGRAARVALLRAVLGLGGEGAWEGREDADAGRGDVVVDLVPVREDGNRPIPCERADAEHMRQRRRVARVRPGPGRRIGVVPDRSHDHGTPAVRPAERLRLERRERIPVGIAWIAEAPQAHVDHARVVLDRPADRLHLGLDVDQVVAVHDLGDEKLGRRGGAGDPDRVVDTGCDQPGDKRPMALLVDAGGAADERLRVGDLARKVGMVAVDAGVDHGDPDRREDRRRLPEVERPVELEVPLLRREGVVRDVRGPAAAESLDVDRTAKVAQPGWARALHDERRDRRQALGARQLCAESSQVGGGRGADRVAGSVGLRRQQCRSDEYERDARHPSSIWPERPSANPWAGAVRAR